MEVPTVFFIEQNLLPFRFSIGRADTFEDCCKAIREMQVRGAGAIGAMAGFAMALACRKVPEDTVRTDPEKARKSIESIRPTAWNLFHATDLVFSVGMDSPDQAIREAQRIADSDANDCRKIGETGVALIGEDARILTHCNAGWLAFVDYGTALSPVYLAHRSGKRPFVYIDETRPRSQGARLTAWELNNEGISHLIIPDNAGATLMAQGKVDLVITGADRIAANGDVANKIGTLEKAIVAREFGIPFYVAAPLSTFDLSCASGGEIPIEVRDENEVLYQDGPDEDDIIRRIRVSSPGSHAWNPAFDITPAKYVTGIITEKGIIKPGKKEIRNLEIR